jgi:hypothetical protein
MLMQTRRLVLHATILLLYIMLPVHDFEVLYESRFHILFTARAKDSTHSSQHRRAAAAMSGWDAYVSTQLIVSAIALAACVVVVVWIRLLLDCHHGSSLRSLAVCTWCACVGLASAFQQRGGRALCRSCEGCVLAPVTSPCVRCCCLCVCGNQATGVISQAAILGKGDMQVYAQEGGFQVSVSCSPQCKCLVLRAMLALHGS